MKPDVNPDQAPPKPLRSRAAGDNAGMQSPLLQLASGWAQLMAAPLVGATLAIGASFLITPLYTAKTLFLPPQQQQNSAASALASLGALSGLAGAAGMKSTSDQYVSLMQSVNVQDRIVDRFKLMEAYDVAKRVHARRELEKRVRIVLGKKDGLISVEVDDEDPKRAADIANQHVAELRRLSSELSLTEAQQRRNFFESELKRNLAALGAAQQRLQDGGFNANAIKAEPKAAVENYAKLKADTTAAEVRLRALRTRLADSAPEIQQQLAQVSILNAELRKLEGAAGGKDDADYLGHFREFKYQETLYELLSKQFELARLDEAREGAMIQVVDTATSPEQRSSPKRSIFAAVGAVAGLLLAAAYLLTLPLWVSARHRMKQRA